MSGVRGAVHADGRAGAGDDLSTPALVLDLDTFDANVAAMATMLEGTGTTVRPHVKTHRTPALALRQLGGPAVGVTCATVGEVEAFARAGIRDLLLANEIADPGKMRRLAEVARDARVLLAVDTPLTIEALAAAARSAGSRIELLIDVDVLIHRCGVADVAEALALAAAIERHPELALAGVMGYEGRVRPATPDRAARIGTAYALLGEVVGALRAAGHPVDVVSAAGTSTIREAIADPGITELQAGVYCAMEPELLALDLPFACAVTVRSTVISRRGRNGVVDAGRREIGMEYGPPLLAGGGGHARFVSDEHTAIEFDDAAPPLGATVDLVPGQLRTTFNLHDRVWLTRGGEVQDWVPVAARGRSW